MKSFTRHIKYIVWGLIILFAGLFVLPIAGSTLFLNIMGDISSGAIGTAIIEQSSLPSILALAYVLFVSWPFIAIIWWVFQDCKKFKAQGIKTNTYLWGLGMVFPANLVAFPLYQVRRNITWPNQLTGRELEIIPANNVILHSKKSWLKTTFITLVVFYVVLVLVSLLLIEAGTRNREFGAFLVNLPLKYSCKLQNGGCDELRPVPELFQNKIIVFNEGVRVEFDPRYEPEVGLHNLDILGGIGTNAGTFSENEIVDPKMKQSGVLLERKYIIVRAVYHYNCSYCFDSGDYAYLVVEDSAGNRFNMLFNDEGNSWGPEGEQSLFDLGRAGEYGKLVGVN